MEFEKPSEHPVTSEGVEFLNRLVEFYDQPENHLTEAPEWASEHQINVGASQRVILELPDRFTQEAKPSDHPYDTQYVAKVACYPHEQNFNEVNVWNTLKDKKHLRERLAPVVAWDSKYRWVVMRRITPGLVEKDTDKVKDAASELAEMWVNDEESISRSDFNSLFDQTISKDFRHDAIGPQRLKNLFARDGWDFRDPDENLGYDRVRGNSCFFDYGALYPPGYDADSHFEGLKEARDGYHSKTVAARAEEA